MAIYGNDLGSGLGAERRAYLDKMLLENTTQKTFWDRLATITKPLPLKESKVIEFEKWIKMLDLYFTDNINEDFTGNDVDAGEETLQMIKRDEYKNFMLDEGSSGTSKGQMKLIKMQTNVFAIGDWMPYTEELELFHNRWSTAEAIKQMSDMSALVIDGYYRDLYQYGAGHVFDISGDGTGNDNVIDAAFTASEKKLVNALKLSGCEPMNEILGGAQAYDTIPIWSRYVAYGHIMAIDALIENPNWKPLEKYVDAIGGKPLPNEIGMLGRTRFCEDPNGFIEPSGTAGEYIAEFVIGGKDHTAQVPLRGKGVLQTVTKGIGSGGTSDPLDRVGTVGWKGWLGAKVLYPERLGILKARFNY
jgi:N4-gp56 family major capsid protein